MIWSAIWLHRLFSMNSVCWEHFICPSHRDNKGNLMGEGLVDTKLTSYLISIATENGMLSCKKAENNRQVARSSGFHLVCSFIFYLLLCKGLIERKWIILNIRGEHGDQSLTLVCAENCHSIFDR